MDRDAGYDLIEDGHDGEPSPRGLPRTIAETPVPEEALCRRCGYALRGLTIHGRCPECGTSVGWSIRGDLLRYSDPDWVERLARGTLWIIVGVLGGLLASIIVASFGGLAEPGASEAVAWVLSIGASLVALVGYWLVTTPEPWITAEAAFSVRHLARWGVVAGFLGGLVPDWTTVATGPAFSVVAILSLILSLGGFVGFIALFVHARRIARRVPDARLASHTSVVMWGIVSGLGLMLLTALGAILAAAGGAAGAVAIFGIFGVFGCVAGLALLVFSIWSIVLLFQYRAALTQAAARARETWHREHDPDLRNVATP